MKYASADAFEAALSARLRQRTPGQTNTEFQRLRRYVAFNRFLARLISVDADNWLLKGGVALEYRMPAEARSTTDLDLSSRSDIASFTKSITDAIAIDLEDHFQFVFTREPYRPVADLATTYRFSLEARLNKRRFEPLTLDVGFADPWLDVAEHLTAPDLLSFAEIAPVTVRAIPIVQHIAEKVHAYTRTYERENTRAKDLVDIILLSSHRPIEGSTLRRTFDDVFEARKTHKLPIALPEPPPGWAGPYRVLASPLGIENDLAKSYSMAAEFIDPVIATPNMVQDATWDPKSRSWIKTLMDLPEHQRESDEAATVLALVQERSADATFVHATPDVINKIDEHYRSFLENE